MHSGMPGAALCSSVVVGTSMIFSLDLTQDGPCCKPRSWTASFYGACCMGLHEIGGCCKFL